MITPSAIAFDFTRQAFHRGSAAAYFWTFTFPDVAEVNEAVQRWNHFLVLLRRSFPSCYGFRVFEVHPGGHGLHVHFVCSERLPVQEIRKLSTRAGFGRIHVVAIDPDRTGYLGKYLSKERPQCLKGRRLWAPFGNWPEGESPSKVRDIKRETFRAFLYGQLSTRYGWDNRRRGQYGYKMRLLGLCAWYWVANGELPANPVCLFPRVAWPPSWLVYYHRHGFISAPYAIYDDQRGQVGDGEPF